MPNAIGEEVKSCVIDGEAVAWDAEKKQILPFQVLSTRKRKVGVATVCSLSVAFLLSQGGTGWFRW